MGYEPKELTDEEWERLMRMEEMSGKSTPESLERCFQEMKARMEEDKELFDRLAAIPELK